jgi:hypothetical protein
MKKQNLSINVQFSPHAIDAYNQKFKRDTWGVGKSARLLVDFIDGRSSNSD